MKFESFPQKAALLFLLIFPSITEAQSSLLSDGPTSEQRAFASNILPGVPKNEISNTLFKPLMNDSTGDGFGDGYIHEDPDVPHYLPFSGACYPGTGNRFTGSWHSNLYIGNNNGSNVLLGWGQNMKDYTGIGTGNDTTPRIVSAASYNGIPYEVRSSSSGSSTGLSAMVLRTSTNLYVFGTAANLTSITTYAGFGGIAINTAASNVTAKLPAGVAISDIIRVAVSQTALAIVTTTGHVYILTTVANLQGDQAAANSAIWHHVTLTGGVTPLTGVTKLSLSSSGAFALVGATNKIYYWGAPANVAGVANTTTSYNYAYDMSAQIPSGQTVTDLVCLGTKTGPSPSTLFLLCNNHKVYGCGLNTNGVLGINNTTTTFNQPTFITVKGTDGTTDLANIAKIDGDTEGDVFCMGAMNTSGQVYGWGDSPAGMLGVNAGTGSFAVPKTVQLFQGTAPGTGYSDFSVGGHFTIAFYYHLPNDQYWYLGHNVGGSIGDPANVTIYILAAAPAVLNAPSGISFDCSNVLPLTWLSFTAKKQATSVLLNWSTTTELNTRDFLVQHSTDGIIWETIGTLPSAGNSSSVENYSFVDNNPTKGINYYRLLQQDIDGKSSYSKIVSVLFTANTNQILLSNTVVNGKLIVQLDQPTTVSLYNNAGVLLIRKELPAGVQIIITGTLAKGIYLLKAGNVTEKFMIQ